MVALLAAVGLTGLIAGLARALPNPASNASPDAGTAAVSTIYQLPPTMAPENEYLRSNGQLLVTCLTCNTLSQIDPNLGPSQTRRTVYTFPDAVLNVLGIDELATDVFAIAVGQLDLSSGVPPNTTNLTSLIRGPTGVYVVDLRNYQAPSYDSSAVRATKVGGSNGAVLFDGLAVINKQKGLVATTDIVEGSLWLIDIPHQTYTPLLSSPSLPSSNGRPSSLLLANGLKYNDSNLYFTGSATGTYGFVPVDPSTGKTTGPAQVIYDYGIMLDDFNFGPTGNVYFTTFAQPGGGILKRAAGTPAGVNGTTQPIDYFGTNSVIARNATGGNCELIMTAVLRAQVIKATIPGAC